MRTNPPEEKPLQTASFVGHATRGLIRDQGVRRKMMMAVVIGALAMMIAGFTFLHGFLNGREHPMAFIIFWLACAWLTVLALLLALFDLLIVRAQARAARKILRDQVSSPPTADSPSKHRGG